MLKRIRRILAVVTFVGITLLFLDFTGVLHHYIGWMAKIQLLPALLALNIGVIVALIVVTLLFGRIYCSVVCPLGVMQDIIAWLGGRRWKGKHRWAMRPKRYSYSPAISWLRYAALIVMIVAVAAGIGSWMALLAPYSSYGRIATTLLQPLYIAVNNLLAGWAEQQGSYLFYEREIWVRSLPTLIIAAVTFIIIAILAIRGGRTYCNTICPVGTLLGFLSRFSWLKIRIDKEKCVGCGLCSGACKASCIDFKNHEVDYSRCVACGVCIDKCHSGALTYGHKAMKTSTENAATTDGESIDKGRRAFLIGTALATASTLMAQKNKKVDGGLAKIEDKVAPERKTPVTPPGSLSAMNMARHCTGCQLCVSECPNDVLRPSTDLLRMMQPHSSFERGYCRPECTRCSEVCPTGAIQRITMEEKAVIQTGHAVWIKENCIPVTEGQACGNCARHCPTGAIQMVPIDPKGGTPPEGAMPPGPRRPMLMIPAVNISICIGCGACENLCPARPLSAIYVEGHEQHSLIK